MNTTLLFTGHIAILCAHLLYLTSLLQSCKTWSSSVVYITIIDFAIISWELPFFLQIEIWANCTFSLVGDITVDCPAGSIGGFLLCTPQILSRSLLNCQSDRSGNGQVMFPPLWGIKIKIKEKCLWKHSFSDSTIGHWVKGLATKPAYLSEAGPWTGMVEEGSNPGMVSSPLHVSHASTKQTTKQAKKETNFF